MSPDSLSRQMIMARLLSHTVSARVDSALLRRVSAELPYPSTELVLALTILLAALHNYTSALRILSVATSCASHGELHGLKPCTSKPGYTHRAYALYRRAIDLIPEPSNDGPAMELLTTYALQSRLVKTTEQRVNSSGCERTDKEDGRLLK